MKKLIILCSLMFTTFAVAEVKTISPEIQIEVTEEKNAQQQYNYNFGVIPVNARARHNVRINNTGNRPLYFRDAAMYGQGFGAGHNCWGVLNPRQACLVTLDFIPYWEGYHNAQFAIYFDQAQIFFNMSGFARR